MRIRSVKPEIRVLGVEDGGVKAPRSGVVDVTGVVYRGGYWLDGVMQTTVEVNGTDATERIAAMILSSPHYGQLRAILLSSIALAGLNIVDIRRLHERLGLPVIVVMRDGPDLLKELRERIQGLPNYEERWRAIQSAGEPVKITVHGEEVHLQFAGLSRREAERVVRVTSMLGGVPEALRVARLVASRMAELKNRGKV